MKKKERFRNKIVQFWVSESEYSMIQEKAKYCNLTISAYLRKVGVDGYIIRRDFGGLNEINKIGININQIARRVNSNDQVIERDVEELRVQYEKMFEVVYAQIIEG